MSLQQWEVPKVLVVGDNEAARERLSELLTGEGYSCAEAVDGRGAVMYLRHAQRTGALPRLVLLDVKMPESARAFHEQQIEDSTLASIPVVVISGMNEQDAAAHVLNAVDQVARPVDRARLFAIARKYCG